MLTSNTIRIRGLLPITHKYTVEVGGGIIMKEYIFDLTVVALLVIGFTATLGVLTNGIGERLFGGKKRTEFVDQSEKVQTGWNYVGGKK